MQDYMKLHQQQELFDHIMELEARLRTELTLAEARNNRDPDSLLNQVNEMAVTIEQLNS